MEVPEKYLNLGPLYNKTYRNWRQNHKESRLIHICPLDGKHNDGVVGAPLIDATAHKVLGLQVRFFQHSRGGIEFVKLTQKAETESTMQLDGFIHISRFLSIKTIFKVLRAHSKQKFE